MMVRVSWGRHTPGGTVHYWQSNVMTYERRSYGSSLQGKPRVRDFSFVIARKVGMGVGV